MKKPIRKITVHHSGEFALVPLACGNLVKIDLADVEEVGKYNWSGVVGYATTGFRKDGKVCKIIMHRLINKTPKGLLTDHINRDPLDNRRSNLRSCTSSQNMANQAPQINPCKSSKYKGVSLNPMNGLFQAQICYQKKIIPLGKFHREEDAARAYDKEALYFFGEFAFINFLRKVPSEISGNL